MKRSYVFLATGFEEIEALATVDVMRRAGMDVSLVSILKDCMVTGAHGVTVAADFVFDDADFSDVDWLIYPGGMPGSTNLHDFAPLGELLKKHYKAGGHIASICAAPALVLAPLGILDGRAATCYPGMESELIKYGARYIASERVVTDGNVITGNGPSSAIPFAAAIVKATLGADTTQAVTDGMLCNMR